MQCTFSLLVTHRSVPEYQHRPRLVSHRITTQRKQPASQSVIPGQPVHNPLLSSDRPASFILALSRLRTSNRKPSIEQIITFSLPSLDFLLSPSSSSPAYQPTQSTVTTV